jgi:glycine dehydrogenase subunit 1
VGVLEDLAVLAQAVHEAGALLVVATNPILLGVMEPPGSFGADIVVGEGQPLGSPMSLGGPGLGFFACREKHVRQMPGRLVGRTTDVDGNPAFVLTLSTREQHIRREKATSNIQEGLSGMARSCMAKARYLRSALLSTGNFEEPWDLPFGYEFALVYSGDSTAYYEKLFSKGYVPGVVLETGEDGADLVLFAVTERRTRAQMDAFVKEVAAL